MVKTAPQDGSFHDKAAKLRRRKRLSWMAENTTKPPFSGGDLNLKFGSSVPEADAR
jgi:hypothetical protein